VTELFLLASAFEADILFGLPDKKNISIDGRRFVFKSK